MSYKKNLVRYINLSFSFLFYVDVKLQSLNEEHNMSMFKKKKTIGKTFEPKRVIPGFHKTQFYTTKGHMPTRKSPQEYNLKYTALFCL
jgi:hypothetical protein